VFALRMSNDRDQQIVQSAVSDTGSGLLEFLPALGQREAIAFGDGVSLPVRIKFDEMPKSALPRSSTARFSEKWQKSIGDEGFLEQVVERWRASGAGPADQSANMAMMAEALGITGAEEAPLAMEYADERVEAVHGEPARLVAPAAAAGGSPYPSIASRQSALRRDPALPPPLAGSPTAAPAPAAQRSSLLRRDAVPAPAPAPEAAAGQGIKSLRDRLLQRPAGR
jgi:hypothetical protein